MRDGTLKQLRLAARDAELSAFMFTIKAAAQRFAVGMALCFCVASVAFAVPREPQGATQARTPTLPPSAPNPVSVDVREQLFATLCALDAAGFRLNPDATEANPAREQLRQQMLAQHGPAADAVRKFYREHEMADPTDTLSRFVSFGLGAGPPPKFAFEVRRDELPPDALSLEGFNDILARFYREANLGELWKQHAQDYERGMLTLRAPVANVVLIETSYLREIVKLGSLRSFTVYAEPLVGGKTFFRNFGDHYALVINPNLNIPLDDIRHAFLHFLLDPLAIRYREEARADEPLLNFAARAPRLDIGYHNDYSSFFSECLVRAVELRLRHLAPGQLNAAIDDAERDGFVLVRPLYAGLGGFEKSEPAMTYYLPDLIKSIKVADEERRLQTVKFASTAPPANAPVASPQSPPEKVAPADPDLAADLAAGEREMAAHDPTAASASFQHALASHPHEPRALYGLAVASAQQGDVARARLLFQQVVGAAAADPAGTAEQRPDPLILSWSHIYLGKLYDYDGSRERAIAEYKAALAVPGAPEAARAAAQQGVDVGYQPAQRDRKPGGGL